METGVEGDEASGPSCWGTVKQLRDGGIKEYRGTSRGQAEPR